jgi:CheY-like chemotaxis protein
MNGNVSAMKSVLIVEDEIFVAMDIERILSDAGHKVVAIASDQKEALSIADQIELAFVDVNLRDGATGPQIARELSSRFGARIIYVTANPAQIGEVAPTSVGCIRKPFSEAAILAAAALADRSVANTAMHEEIIPL